MDEKSLTRLKELTADNSHTLALWFIARELDNKMNGAFGDYQDGFANIFAEHMLVGEVSDELNNRALLLQKAMFRRISDAFGDEQKEAIRMCL